jgi:dCMP deaminase
VNRITREQMFMEIAHVVAKRSTCMRLSVGCVLVQNKNIVSVGYNGPPAGEPHCTGRGCSPPGQGCQRAVHAEINAFKKIKPGVTSAPLDVYATDSPCLECFEFMTQEWWKVSSIFFTTLYRVNAHLHHPHIGIYQITPSGYVIDYQSGELVNG